MTEYVTTTLCDRVAYDRYCDGPGLIFVAGAGPFRAIDPVTTATAELAAEQGLATIVYDRLGRGESEATGRIGLDREFAALRALMDLLGGEAALCGHSSGCSISLAAAANGLPVTALALWEAPIAPVGTVAEWIGEVERRMDAGDFDGALTHYMKDMPPEWLEQAKQDPMYELFAAQVVSYRADGESLVWADSGPQAELFANVRVPTEFLLGEKTFDEMHAAAAAVLATIPGSAKLELPGADHTWDVAPMAAELARFILRAVS